MSRIPGVVYGWRGIVKGILYRVTDTNDDRWVEGVLLRLHCIVSRVFYRGEGILLKIFCIVSRTPRVL